MKYIKVFILSLSLIAIVLFIFSIYMSRSITVDYSISNIYKTEFLEYKDTLSVNNKEDVNGVMKEFNMSKDVAKDFISNPENFALVVLECRINNNSPFSINNYNFGLSSNDMEITILDDYWGDITSRNIKSRDYSINRIAAILKYPDNFDFEQLYKYKFRIYGHFILGCFISKSANYTGLYDIEQCEAQSLIETLNESPEIIDFITSYDTDSKYKFSSVHEYFTPVCSVQRISKNADYMISKFIDDNIVRYIITYFNKSGYLIGGMLFSGFTEKEDYSEIIVGKSNFTDIKKIDSKAFMIMNNGKYVSYHHFKDGMYIEVEYKKVNSIFEVANIKTQNNKQKCINELLDVDLNKLIKM